MANNYEEFASMFPFPEKAAVDFTIIVNALATGKCDKFPVWFKDILLERDNRPWDKIDRNEKAELVSDWLDENASESWQYNESISLCDTDYSHGQLYVGGSSENGNDLESTAKLLHAVMREHQVNEPVAIMQAYYCSKLRPGEFGGFAVAISRDDILWEGTANLCEKLKSQLKERQTNQQTPAP